MLALAVGLLGLVLWLLIGHPQPEPTPQGKPDEGPVGEIANMSGFRSGQTALTVRFFPNELEALTTEHGVGYRTWDLEKRKLLPSSGNS